MGLATRPQIKDAATKYQGSGQIQGKGKIGIGRFYRVAVKDFLILMGLMSLLIMMRYQ